LASKLEQNRILRFFVEQGGAADICRTGELQLIRRAKLLLAG
jgi:hypothetical protein